MRWFKRDRWKIAIPLAGLLLLLLFMVLIPLSASAHGGIPGVAIVGTPTPTVDLTVTVLAKEQLALQVKQLQNQLENQNNWFANNSTAIIAAVTAIVVAFIGFTQWAGNRRDERQKAADAQDKDRRAQAEERFKTAVTALGDAKEGTQVGGAILLRSFLNKEDEGTYGRYYTQIFDLAVAYLRLRNIDPKPESPNSPNQALIRVFRESFPLARDLPKQNSQSLDALGIRLDRAYLARSDLNGARMPESYLREANLIAARLRGANLRDANLTGADLSFADLNNANLSGADLSKAKIERASNLEGANLRGVTGLTKDQLVACKSRGAIIDKDTTTGPPQSPSSPPSQSINTAAPSSPPSQVTTPLPSTDGGSATASQPSTEP